MARILIQTSARQLLLGIRRCGRATMENHLETQYTKPDINEDDIRSSIEHFPGYSADVRAGEDEISSYVFETFFPSRHET